LVLEPAFCQYGSLVSIAYQIDDQQRHHDEQQGCGKLACALPAHFAPFAKQI
jgi:hypothetical protein